MTQGQVFKDELMAGLETGAQATQSSPNYCKHDWNIADGAAKSTIFAGYEVFATHRSF